MSNILIMEPLPIAAIAAAPGTGAANLLSPHPKEVFSSPATGDNFSIDIDLGSVQIIDTIFLGFLWDVGAAVTRTIAGGVAGHAEFTIATVEALRAVDAAGTGANPTHALWTAAAVAVRYIRIFVGVSAGHPSISAGIVMVGKAFRPTYNQEWGRAAGDRHRHGNPIARWRLCAGRGGPQGQLQLYPGGSEHGRD
jgi:hypothetical protein